MVALTKNFRRIATGVIVAGLFTATGYAQEETASSDTFNIPNDITILGDNNPNVRVAFHWRNNGNGAGTDPSVAIDDIRVAPDKRMKRLGVAGDGSVLFPPVNFYRSGFA